MDNIREWISDNLRYILLGLALVLVLAIAVLGIRAISNIANGSGSPSGDTEAIETESDTAATSDVIVETETDNTSQTSILTRNDARVLTVMTSYYAARTNGDTETLRKLDPSMDEQEEASMTSSYVESYSDISTYSKPGLTAGSYLVYVCYNGKLKNIETLVPSLIECYLMTDEEGNLYIADTDGDEKIKAFCAENSQSEEVQNLVSSVQSDLEAAENADPALTEFMAQYGNSPSSGDSDADESGETEGTEIVALDVCNIRSTPEITDDNIIGSLYTGETATKLGETADGWTEIDYNGESAYVSSEFVATPEEAQAQEEAEYFAPAAAE